MNFKYFVITFILFALVLAGAVFRMQPPDAPMERELNEFSAVRTIRILERLITAETPHPTNSVAGDAVLDRIYVQLEEVGYDVEIQETLVCREFSGFSSGCSIVKNIVTQLAGHQNADGVMLVSHYDSVAVGSGVADDGAGVATMLEIARILHDEGPRPNTIYFLFTDAEEVGQLGAQGFVQSHDWFQHVQAVINLEARGTSGLSLMFETSEHNAELIDSYALSVPRPAASSLFFEVYRYLPNETDLSIFKDSGVKGANFAFIENVPFYHTRLDNFNNLNLGSLQHHGDSILALVRELAGRDISKAVSSNDVYLDIMGVKLIHWPEIWTTPLVLLSFFLFLSIIVFFCWQKETTIQNVMWGLGGLITSLLLAAVLSFGLLWLMKIIKGSFFPWYAFPLPTRLSLWAISFFSSSAMALSFARKAGVWGHGLGAWLGWVLLAIPVGIIFPGAAIYFLIPNLLISAFLIIGIILRQKNGTLSIANVFIIGGLSAGVVWLPIVLLLEQAVGLDLGPVIALVVTLVFGTLAPVFVSKEDQPQSFVRRGFVLAAAIFAISGGIIALLMPAYTETYPQRLNLIYLKNQDLKNAYWAVESPDQFVPIDVQQAANFENEAAIYPWSDRLYPIAEADVLDLFAPDLEILSNEVVQGERQVKIRFLSSPEIHEVNLSIPIEHLEAVTVLDTTYSVTPDVPWEEVYNFVCFGRSCEHVTLTLHFKDDKPADVWLTGVTYGNPQDAQSQAFVQSRPKTAVSSGLGDLILTLQQIKL